MEKTRRKWNCPQCGHFSKIALTETLKDFYLLFQPNITNKEAREFLQISSESTIRRLLLDLGIPNSGTTKGSIYVLPFDDCD
ncbi:hypothetical protein AN964_19460 [Heyndrickxia shackletonii]|uniref:Transposase n=1 Tax=Heyndrickxia shackletonii TaxID=157838 RepID=A0A0Q3TAT6_9BACI|nr:hypothetical protein AN964_19460 [Heyndrickxia shackletonii]MBB2479063.1 hypothetical protein [Bacillus sp. APMAM]RTZ57255.1 hypothetical protein EKO25_03330 [Bacillus sp. SAJ1]